MRLSRGRPYTQQAPKAEDAFQAAFVAAGESWPLDLTGAETSLEFWGLPPGSFVDLRGLPRRALMLLVLRLRTEHRLHDLGNGDILLTHAERTMGWSQPEVNVCTTVVANMKLVVAHKFQSGSVRLSLATPSELFGLMGMPLDAMFGRQVITDLAGAVSYPEMVRLAGSAFHLPTVVAFCMAVIMLRHVPRPI